MEVTTYFKDKYTVCSSRDTVILVVGEISQEQWTVLVTIFMSFIKTAGIGTIFA